MAADARQHRAPVQDRRFVRRQPPIPRHLTRWLYSVVGANYARSVSRWRGKLRIASLRLLSPQNPLTLGFCGGVFSAYHTSSPWQNRFAGFCQGFFSAQTAPPLPMQTAGAWFALGFLSAQTTLTPFLAGAENCVSLRCAFSLHYPAECAAAGRNHPIDKARPCQSGLESHARARGKITPPTALPRVMISRRRRVSRLHTPATVK